MKVTLLGHATVLVELDGANILMDPVLQDPFEEGAVVSCPKRVVNVDALPQIDLILLSHQHLDHFDLPSLARLPKSANVYCPKDKAIVYALEGLGFEKIHPTASMANLKFPKFELFTTHSSVSNVIEFGVVFRDATGVFWNQVDTILEPATIDMVVKTVGRPDLLFAMYASQAFGFFENKGGGFPDATHAMNLANIVAINPTLVAPGSAGFRFDGPFGWCNSFLFPISRERFLADLAAIAPNIPSTVANPGDVFEISKLGVERRAGASKVATMVDEDTHLLRFDPTAEVPPLTDPNPDSISVERLAQAVDKTFEGLETLARDTTTVDPVLAKYRELGASYVLGVVHPDGTERWLRLELGSETSALRGTGRLPESDAFHRITASALTAWSAREKSYFYFRGFSRQVLDVPKIERQGNKVSVRSERLTDLLGHYLTRRAPGAELALKQRLDQQLAPLRPARR